MTPAKIRDICVELDTNYVSHQRSDVGSVSGQPGSTAVFAIIEKLSDAPVFKILSCNVGDSRILLIDVDEGCFKPLTEDHKPENDIERTRILRAGGCVQNSRVDGTLALSRAFGDAAYKMNDSLDHCQQKVIPVPDFMQAEAKPGHIMLVACDGVFEACNNNEIAEFVIRGFHNGKSLKELTVDLVDYCIIKGSNDNISCQLIAIEKETFPAVETTETYIPSVFFENGNARYKQSFVHEAYELGLDSKDVKEAAPKSMLKKVETSDLINIIRQQQESGIVFPLKRSTPVDGLINLPRDVDFKEVYPHDESDVDTEDEPLTADQDAFLLQCLQQLMANPDGPGSSAQFALLQQFLHGDRDKVVYGDRGGLEDEDEEESDEGAVKNKITELDEK